MPALLKKRALILKQESTRGTFAAPSNSDFDIPFNNDISVTTEIPITEGAYSSGDYDKFAGIVGTMKGQISVSVPLWHSGTVDTAPKIAKLLKLCGLRETVNASTSVVYDFVKGFELGSGGASAGNPFSCVVQDVFANAGGAVHTKFSGCLASAKIVGELGGPAMLQLEIQGVFQGLSDETELVLTGHDTTVPNAFKSATVSAFGISQSVSKSELDFGNVIEMEMDQSSSSGFLAAYIADRTPMFNFDPKRDLVANDAVITRLLAGTEGALSLSTSNWAIAASKAQIIQANDSAQESINSFEQSLRLNRVSAGVPFTLTHT